MQAIETKFLCPTDSRGARVKATCEAKSITLSWDDALDGVANHDAAARALIVKLGWDPEGRSASHAQPTTWFRGAPKGSRGYVYVCAYDTERLQFGKRAR